MCFFLSNVDWYTNINKNNNNIAIISWCWSYLWNQLFLYAFQQAALFPSPSYEKMDCVTQGTVMPGRLGLHILDKCKHTVYKLQPD